MSLQVFTPNVIPPAPPTPPMPAWQRWADVPHRAYFSAGVGSLLLLALWWSVALPLVGLTERPSPLVHALLMPLGVFPPFMLGFVFTAGPRWITARPPQGHWPLAATQVLGLVLALGGFTRGGLWALPGLFVMLLVWWWATWLWFCCLDSAPEADRRHGFCILAAMLVGNLALLAVVVWVLSGDATIWLVARDLVLFGWIVPIFLVVAHRMIPFFTQTVVPQREVWRPISALYACLAACALLVLVSVLTLPSLLTALAALGLAASCAQMSWRWAGGQVRGACAGNRLLAMLHLSFAWLPPAFVLLALGALGVPVGSAPLHALGMGFCLTMMVGFVTRVSFGHSGRPLQASNLYWYLYLALHVLAALRVLLALMPLSPHALHALAAVWLAVLAAWAWQVLPMYWRPRVDGKDG